MEKLPEPIVRDGKEFWYGTEENPFNARSIDTPLGEDAGMIRANQDIRTQFPHLIEKWQSEQADQTSISQQPEIPLQS